GRDRFGHRRRDARHERGAAAAMARAARADRAVQGTERAQRRARSGAQRAGALCAARTARGRARPLRTKRNDADDPRSQAARHGLRATEGIAMLVVSRRADESIQIKLAEGADGNLTLKDLFAKGPIE